MLTVRARDHRAVSYYASRIIVMTHVFRYTQFIVLMVLVSFKGVEVR